MKPNFLIIGAPRCGTTYLARNLATHPEVFVATGDEPDIAGDVHFFDPNTPEGRNNRDKGEAWYCALFSGAESMTAVGEKTADYLVDPEAPDLIARSLDRPALIVIIRDPVERAWSHFCHSRHRLPRHMNFEDLVYSGHDISDVPVLRAGLYYQLLESYIRHFSQDRLLVLVKEDLDQAPATALARVCTFLGVDPEHAFPYINTSINAGSSTRLSSWVARVGRAIRTRLPATYEWLVQGPLSTMVHSLVRRTRGKTEKPPKPQSVSSSSALEGELRRRLMEYYQSDTRETGRLLGMDLERLWWGEPPEHGKDVHS